MLRYAEQLLLTLWLGSLWTVGYLAVPILFASLDERMVAGMLAGKMFTVVSYIGLGCGTALLAMALAAGSRGFRDPKVLLPALMLALVAVGEFVLQPMMAELKAQGLAEGSAAAASFGRLHGIASVIYLINSACGLALLLLAAKRPLGLRAGG